MKDLSEKERRDVAKLLEEDPAFLDFVLNSTTNGVWVGDVNSKNFMKTPDWPRTSKSSSPACAT